ncbi:unnamed protein product [Moneuplotes crassus]|uniref:mRNA 5'-phosphatase n=1 Tax=Euplotes crassus TaxID=5936 RepID=A0AAD1XGZ9_EUPCR|nr:unnamed protein product [Moneuplotes crassus]
MESIEVSQEQNYKACVESEADQFMCAHLVQTVQRIENIEELEIESRLGYIKPLLKNPRAPEGMIFNFKHGVVLPPAKWGGKTIYVFTPGIFPHHYKNVLSVFQELAKAKEEEKLDENTLSDKAKILNKINEDDIFEDLGPHKFTNETYENKIRISKDAEGNIMKDKTMKKTQLDVLNYFNQGYDFRISVKKEESKNDEVKEEGKETEPDTEPESAVSSSKLQMTREKIGRSFKTSYLQFDFNKITETSKYTAKKPSNQIKPKYELEVELTGLTKVAGDVEKLSKEIRKLIRFTKYLYYL